MDRVRFGRALGRGARLAARTAYEAMDAATAPNRTPPLKQASQPERAGSTARETLTPGRFTSTAPGVDTSSVASALKTAGRVHGSVRQAKQGVLAPVKRASRALSLEMTGSFFALFALSFSAAAWKARVELNHGPGAPHFWIYVALASLFGYFAASNFVRARRL